MDHRSGEGSESRTVVLVRGRDKEDSKEGLQPFPCILP